VIYYFLERHIFLLSDFIQNIENLLKQHELFLLCFLLQFFIELFIAIVEELCFIFGYFVASSVYFSDDLDGIVTHCQCFLMQVTYYLIENLQQVMCIQSSVFQHFFT
jgi:hypothetical protein